MSQIKIAGQPVGSGYPAFVIAEAGVNHNGDTGMAHQLIDAAVKAGANAIKFQTFKTEHLVTKTADKATYQKDTTDAVESQYKMLKRLELMPEIHEQLITHCQDVGIIFLSTPFDEPSADLLEVLDVPAFKTPSGDITNLPYLAHIAGKGRPMIVSTGMSYLGEVETALRTIEAAGNPPVVVLHCVSSYPTLPPDVNLRAMHTMATAFNVSVGFSDHTIGMAIPLAAIALGACVLEKHLTLDKTLPGPDHQASMTPDELHTMIDGIREIEAALGDGCKRPTVDETKNAAVVRKSLVAAIDISSGQHLESDMIAIMRPGDGLQPALKPALIGRTAAQDIAAGTVLRYELLV